MLDTRIILFKHAAKDVGTPIAKLAARKVVPFEIIKMINPNVARLKLPQSMNTINSTFNVDVLSKYEPSPEKFRSRLTTKASKFLENGTAARFQVIERLLKKSQFNRQPYWLVQWHGETKEEASWKKRKVFAASSAERILSPISISVNVRSNRGGCLDQSTR